MRKFLFAIALLMVLALPSIASASANGDDAGPGNHFVTKLTGDQETPAVTTDATGRASFTITDNDTKIHFRISSRGLDRIIQAHIHVGARGVAGPIVLFLFSTSTASGPMSGEGWSVSGTVTAADLKAHPEVGAGTFADVVKQIRAGNTYANIHTVAHPGGEIRGQIVAADD
jgi:CHRD domain